MRLRIAAVAVGTLLVGALWAAAQCPSTLTTISNGATVCVGYQAPLYPSTTFAGVPVSPYVGDLDGINSVQRFVNDDFADMNLHPPFNSQVSWNSTSYNAAYVGDNWSTVQGQLKYGSAIGMTGYAQIATLVMAMFSGDINNPSFSGTTIEGVSVTGFTTTQIEKALSEAIFTIANPTALVGHPINSLAAQFVAAVQAAVTSANAKTTLDGYTNLWVFAPQGSGKIELWTLLSVPEGGALLLYLLIAGTVCLGSIKLGGVRKVL